MTEYQTIMPFEGMQAEQRCLETLNQQRLERLTQALEIAGIRSGTVPWNVAVRVLFHVPKNTGGTLEWTNEQIARDGALRKRNGKSPRPETITAAISRLRKVGIVAQTVEPDKAIRWIDHARVARIVESGSVEIFEVVFEVEKGVDFGVEKGSKMGSKKTRAIIGSKEPIPKNQESSFREPDQIQTPNEDEDFCLDESPDDDPYRDQIQSDIAALAPLVSADSHRDRFLLSRWLTMVYRRQIAAQTFRSWLDQIKTGTVARPMAFLKTCVQNEIEAYEVMQ